MDILRRTPLRPMYRWSRRVYRGFYLRSMLQRIVDNPDLSLEDPEILSQLTYGWSNTISASVDYLLECVKYASQAKSPILECGSGLTTIVTGLIAKRTGNTVWSLENSKAWHRTVRHYLEKYRIDSVRLLYCPLVDHGGFFWYDAPLDTMPDKFSLIICDGPLSEPNNKVRRYGMFPVMNRRFMPGSTILYDNADLEYEDENLNSWLNKLEISHQIRGSDQPFSIMTVPQSSQ